MPTQTIDTDLIKQSIDLREYAGRYTTLHRESAKELSGPCPKCGGNDRFHCTADWFACRQCYPLDNGKPHDVIALVQWLDNCSFPEAVARLTNAPMPTPTTKRAPAPKPQAKQQPSDWQRDAKNAVDHAHWRLLEDGDGAPGRAYLEDGRKLSKETWQAFRLGYMPNAPLPGTWDHEKRERIHQGAPAITIPWFKGGEVVAVRYRFLQKHIYTDARGEERTESKSSRSGSEFAGSVFGGQALIGHIPELSTVVLVEGELNAMSVWQVFKDSHLDVFSLGSQDAKPTEAMIAYLKRYAVVMCWLDEGDRAARIAEALPGAYAIKSNSTDANDLLKLGKLGGLLAFHRLEAAKGDKRAQERLLWDLADMGTIDQETQRVIAYIAKMLGKAPMREHV